MTKEEAIKRFENVKANALAQKANGVSEYWQNEIDGTIEAIDLAIASLSAETEWIPCSERLPKVEEQVLCCDSQSRVFTSALTEIASNGMAFFGQHCKVIAWMPLPEPYGERKEEINGFKSVGQAWNTSQERRYK